MINRALAVIAFSTISTQAPGQVPTSDDIMAWPMQAREQFLFTTGEAYGWANAALSGAKQPLLFCAPKEFAFSKGQYELILTNHLRKFPHRRDLPASMVLLKALQEVFACPKN